MARNKLSEEEILARIEQEERTAYGPNDSELSDQRSQAIDYYLGKPFGNEVDGRSQVVSTDVADTIESLLPALLKVFVSGDEVIRFDPKGPEDIQGAEQETAAVNHIVMEQNPGFGVFYTWFKDALLSKNGYVKVYYEETEEVEKEFYSGLTDEELAMIVNGGEVEVIEHTSYPDEIDAQHRQQAIEQNPQAAQQIAQIPPKMLHDVRVQTKKNDGHICIENVPPENMLVSVDTRSVSVQEARFVQHREETTAAELEERGFKVPDDLGFEEYDRLDEEASARDLYSETSAYDDQSGKDRKLIVKDTYIRIDGELHRYVIVGNTILHNEEAEIIPFAAITPVIMPHRHVGRSVADLVMDIQLIKSTLQRGQLDGLYLALNPRHFVSDRVNLDDMLISRPGGIVRVASENVQVSAMPLITPDVSSLAYPMIEYMDTVKENRTGVTKYNQGLDANSLNKTASGINQIMTAAQQRTELIARIFAETGVKELFMLVHRLMRTHSQRELVMRLRNKWVAVDPRQWKTRSDMSVSVGLGTGNKDQMLGHLMTILQAQREGAVIGLATPKNIYNALAKLTQNAGFKNPEEFWTDPGDQPQQKAPPQPSPDAVLMAQTELQKEQMKQQGDAQKFQAQTVVEHQRSQNDVQIEQEKISAQMELERFKAQLKAENDRYIAEVNAETQMKLKAFELAITQQQTPQVEGEAPKDSGANDVLALAIQGFSQALQGMNAPKQVLRDETGRAVGIAPMGAV